MDRDTFPRRARSESGIALVSTLLVLMLMAALMVGFFAIITSDQQSSGVNRDQTEVYAAAHAGLEKLTADLGALFTVNYSPPAAQVNALGNDPPVIAGFQYLAPDGGDGYQIGFVPDANGNPSPESPNGSPITAGPYQGLVGLITPYTINVIARGPGGAEVQMRRTMQTVSVPVFQFGIYSENDLSFFAGPNFNFGGRVHTNQNVFLLQNDGATLTLEDRVTAVGEVVRTHLPNGLASSVSGHQGTIRMARAAGVYRNLAANEGSVTIVGSPPVIPPSLLTTDANGRLVMQLQAPNVANEPTWTNISVGTYNSYIRNGRTGARRLDLPIVSDGARPIDLIRRPDRFNPDIPQVARQRFYSMASLRILLSDTVDDLMNLPGIDASRQPISLENAANFRSEMSARGYPAWLPVATSNGSNAQGYRMTNGSSLLGGFIKIERQNRDGDWFDVTAEILALGTAGRNMSRGTLNTPDFTPGSAPGPICGTEPHPNAIVRIQRLRDTPSNGAFSTVSGYTTVRCGNGSNSDTDYWPNALYDAREGGYRDAPASLGTVPYMGGAMHYVELDVNNFRRWIAGQIGTTGDDNTMDVTGYVVYFSDRRANRGPGPDGVVGTGDDRETGELGFEDFINPTSSMSVPNGVLDTGED
ncbi:MAG: hypothetical protein KJ061_13675, partial [Vicinamibacteraceae bacterium]|nr:hypothetical protein [Vicinamibacteraceae bacterium]